MYSKFDMRDAFITALYDLAVKDPNVIILSNDFGAPALDRFRNDLPKQFINAAISEQNIISTAAGLAKGGKKVVVYSIATFITLRALEQIKIDLCVMNMPVTILAVGTGYAYSTDGPTHHATEDIGVMRVLSNMTIYSPSDSNMSAALVGTIANLKGPQYIRLDRGKYPQKHTMGSSIGDGFVVWNESDDSSVALVSTGGMSHRALAVSEALSDKGITSSVVDLFRLKPLNAESLCAVLGKSKAVVTIEEHTQNGGVGSIIAELMADQNLLLPLKRIAIKDDQLYAYGVRDKLHQDRKLDVDGIVNIILSV
jgi:transketolase